MQSIIDAIEQWLKDFLIGAITGNLSSMFSDVNSKVATIATEVGKTPESWNSSVFSIILTLSKNVVVPIAGLVIAAADLNAHLKNIKVSMSCILFFSIIMEISS